MESTLHYKSSQSSEITTWLYTSTISSEDTPSYTNTLIPESTTDYTLFKYYKFTLLDGAVVAGGLLEIIVIVISIFVAINYMIKGDFRSHRQRLKDKHNARSAAQTNRSTTSADRTQGHASSLTNLANGEAVRNTGPTGDNNSLESLPLQMTNTRIPDYTLDLSDTSIQFGEPKNPKTKTGSNELASRNKYRSYSNPVSFHWRNIILDHSNQGFDDADDSVFLEGDEDNEHISLSTFQATESPTSVHPKEPADTDVKVYVNHAFDSDYTESNDSGHSSKHQVEVTIVPDSEQLRPETNETLDQSHNHSKTPNTPSDLSQNQNRDHNANKCQKVNSEDSANQSQSENHCRNLSNLANLDALAVEYQELSVDTGLPVTEEELQPNVQIRRSSAIRSSQFFPIANENSYLHQSEQHHFTNPHPHKVKGFHSSSNEDIHDSSHWIDPEEYDEGMVFWNEGVEMCVDTGLMISTKEEGKEKTGTIDPGCIGYRTTENNRHIYENFPPAKAYAISTEGKSMDKTCTPEEGQKKKKKMRVNRNNAFSMKDGKDKHGQLQQQHTRVNLLNNKLSASKDIQSASQAHSTCNEKISDENSRAKDELQLMGKETADLPSGAHAQREGQYDPASNGNPSGSRSKLPELKMSLGNSSGLGSGPCEAPSPVHKKGRVVPVSDNSTLNLREQDDFLNAPPKQNHVQSKEALSPGNYESFTWPESRRKIGQLSEIQINDSWKQMENKLRRQIGFDGGSYRNAFTGNVNVKSSKQPSKWRLPIKKKDEKASSSRNIKMNNKEKNREELCEESQSLKANQAQNQREDGPALQDYRNNIRFRNETKTENTAEKAPSVNLPDFTEKIADRSVSYTPRLTDGIAAQDPSKETLPFSSYVKKSNTLSFCPNMSDILHQTADNQSNQRMNNATSEQRVIMV